MLINILVCTNLVDLFHTLQYTMKRNLLLFCILLTQIIIAQDYKRCGTDEMVKKALENEPNLLKNRQRLAHFADSVLSNNIVFKNTERTIPVVVHVIYTDESNNISEEQVHDAMRIINEDFNKENSDAANVVPEFQSIIADMGVRFKLANLDPYGNCTKGITRTYSELTHDAGENVKEELVRWDPSMYLNIWVVETLSNGAGGYSYYPGSAPNNDLNAGIVVSHEQFGSIGTSNGGNFSARTLTHEIGHYLNLPHTWGSTNDNYLEENCSEDDGISDTPNTIGSNQTCNLNQTTCGSLDNVENYMDYSTCSKMYTQGQKDIVTTALEYGGSWGQAPRSNLWSVNNLWNTGTHENYNAPDCVAIINFSSSSNSTCTNNTINWSHDSYNYDSIVNILWEFEGGSPAQSNDENPSVLYENPGVYEVSLTITTTGGSATKTISEAVYVQNAAQISEAPATISFSTNLLTISPSHSEDWFVNSTEPSWSWHSASSTSSSAGSVRIRSDNFSDPESKGLISPIFDFTNVPTPCYLYYDYAYALKNNSSEDRLKVNLTRDCGTTWQTRLNKTSENLITLEGTYAFPFTPPEHAWETQKININSWSGDEMVQMMFEFNGTGGNYLYIDNIRFGVPLLSNTELLAKTLDLEVYPNPTDGYASIAFNLLKPSKAQFSLVDIIGNTISVLQKDFNAGSQKITLESIQRNLEPGIYFLEANFDNYKERKKIIIQ